MSLLRRLRRVVRGNSGSTRSGRTGGDAAYLADWVRTHPGVEGFIEPKTTLTDVTVVLVAEDGEWTRRIVGERGAARLADELRIPVHDVHRTGYPQRMRDYDARQRIERQRALKRDLDGL